MGRRYSAYVLQVAIIAVAAVLPGLLRAQAPPGPITGVTPAPPSQSVGSSQSGGLSPAANQVQPRKGIAGAWRLNRDESSSPSDRNSNGGYPNGGNGPYGGGGGNGPYGGGGGNGPYGRPRAGGGIGSPFPGSGSGGNGPYGGGQRPNGGGIPDERQQPQQAMRPSNSLTIEQKDNEIDLIDDRRDRTALFTDGRKIQKPNKNDPVREVAAHWENRQLVTDEKTPQGDKLSRTFELSPNGLQLIETVRTDNRRSSTPLTLRYVYDAAS